ncbi:MAG TPA: DnaJ domain-containing protein [Xanthobacteraceae bacterium]|nr:DnaJ domain-containing protein [Xanthobacteraceae bacterium]
MATLALGLALLIVILWGIHLLARADPRRLARGLRSAGGVGALALAAVFAMRGAMGFAIPLGIAGLAILGLWPGAPAALGSRWRKSPGQTSRVRTAFIEMELDHDTGAMRGRVLGGPHGGASLDALDLSTLVRLAGEIDEESRALLVAYLDRRQPGWREHADDRATAGSGPPPRSGPMTEEEAYQILGLQPGAGADEITRAHRALMKKLHPDQGGSTYLAARVNQAKDVLLRRHR